MADGDPLPGSDHVARYCQQSGFQGGQISDANFAPRPRDNGRLSTNWVECRYVPARERSEAGAVARLLRSLKRNRPEDRVAFLQIEAVRGINDERVILDVREDGHGVNRCHAVILNVASATSSLDAEFEAQAGLARLARNRSRPALG
jgi:hypothetical protein